MIERVAIRPYRLPLRRCWRSSHGGFSERRGWLVSVESGGTRGYGDCAPLPAAGTETTEAAADTLLAWRHRMVGRTLEAALSALDQSSPATPAARFALESALLDLASRQARQPLRRLLDANATDTLPVNIMLGALEGLSTPEIEMACSEGFSVLKLKVGAGDPAAEIECLTALSESLPPGVSLRLDANGAWSPAEATRFIEALYGLPIESIEEPLRQPLPADLTRLQMLAPFPLALDESLYRTGTGIDPASVPVRRLVLKPAVVGGLRRTLALASRAQAAGVEVVITSLVESAAGLWPTAQLAAAIASPIPHGLATGRWLAEDLGTAPKAQNGRLALGERPGSGFNPANA